ncbi:putative leucine-rich repeat domain-containing protein [Blattamonas nauphoetae]|uniref:Leucine-rich repeat domain-containing protein n=1 Tax=Blattamonas nauphoetae TaxID=2049346 RepID=A0ABQ9XJE5_9EUKA|nr:putative leucine-rich repeat domain-containing protein [Blattamonas nauphoetae]
MGILFPALGKLKLMNNRLHTLPLITNKKLTDLVADSNFISSLEHQIDAPQLQNLVLPFNELQEFSIPKNSFLNSLKVLDLRHNKLESLDFSTISSLPNLRILRVSFNKLMTMPDNIFKTLPAVNTLLAHDNLLVHLPDSLSHVHDLAMLNAQNNMISEASCLSTIKSTAGCKVILNSNLIGHIPPLSRRIISLIVEDNLVSNIESGIDDGRLIGTNGMMMDGGPAVSTLSLRFNQLGRFPEQLLTPPLCQTLTTLQLAGNGISIIPDGISNLLHLVSLDVSFNRITTIPPSMAKLQKIQELNLAFNEIEELPAFIVSFPYLKILRLSSNRLKTFPTVSQLAQHQNVHNELLSSDKQDMVKEPSKQMIQFVQSSLTLSPFVRVTLDLNQIVAFPNVLLSVPSIETLNLAYNCLSFVPALLFIALPALSRLDLSYNPIQSLPPNLITSSICNVISLNLSHTLLTSLPTALFEATEDLSPTHLQYLEKNLSDSFELVPPIQISTNQSPDQPDSVFSGAKVTFKSSPSFQSDPGPLSRQNSFSPPSSDQQPQKPNPQSTWTSPFKWRLGSRTEIQKNGKDSNQQNTPPELGPSISNLPPGSVQPIPGVKTLFFSFLDVSFTPLTALPIASQLDPLLSVLERHPLTTFHEGLDNILPYQPSRLLSQYTPLNLASFTNSPFYLDHAFLALSSPLILNNPASKFRPMLVHSLSTSQIGLSEAPFFVHSSLSQLELGMRHRTAIGEDRKKKRRAEERKNRTKTDLSEKERDLELERMRETLTQQEEAHDHTQLPPFVFGSIPLSVDPATNQPTPSVKLLLDSFTPQPPSFTNPVPADTTSLSISQTASTDPGNADPTNVGKDEINSQSIFAKVIRAEEEARPFVDPKYRLLEEEADKTSVFEMQTWGHGMCSQCLSEMGLDEDDENWATRSGRSSARSQRAKSEDFADGGMERKEEGRVGDENQNKEQNVQKEESAKGQSAGETQKTEKSEKEVKADGETKIQEKEQVEVTENTSPADQAKPEPSKPDQTSNTDSDTPQTSSTSPTSADNPPIDAQPDRQSLSSLSLSRAPSIADADAPKQTTSPILVQPSVAERFAFTSATEADKEAESLSKQPTEAQAETIPTQSSPVIPPLSKPLFDITSPDFALRLEHPSLSHHSVGFSETIGPRPTMEDACLLIPTFGWDVEALVNTDDFETLAIVLKYPQELRFTKRGIAQLNAKLNDKMKSPCYYEGLNGCGLFVLCDGHKGCQASHYIAAHFVDTFLVCSWLSFHDRMTKSHSDIHTDQQPFLVTVLTRTLQMLNEEMVQRGVDGGCTCLVCVVGKDKVTTANVGDSRAILVSRVKKSDWEGATDTKEVDQTLPSASDPVPTSKSPTAPLPHPPPPVQTILARALRPLFPKALESPPSAASTHPHIHNPLPTSVFSSKYIYLSRPLTIDHKPFNLSEQAFIRRNGGVVSLDGRVNGNLAVSRAMADFTDKPAVSGDCDVFAERVKRWKCEEFEDESKPDNEDPSSESSNNSFFTLLDWQRDIKPYPSLHHPQRVSDPYSASGSFGRWQGMKREDVAIVLGCDGVWDVLSNQQIAGIVEYCIEKVKRRRNERKVAIEKEREEKEREEKEREEKEREKENETPPTPPTDQPSTEPTLPSKYSEIPSLPLPAQSPSPKSRPPPPDSIVGLSTSEEKSFAGELAELCSVSIQVASSELYSMDNVTVVVIVF